MTDDERLKDIREYYDFIRGVSEEYREDMTGSSRVAFDDVAWLVKEIDTLRAEAKAARGKIQEEK